MNERKAKKVDRIILPYTKKQRKKAKKSEARRKANRLGDETVYLFIDKKIIVQSAINIKMYKYKVQNDNNTRNYYRYEFIRTIRTPKIYKYV